MHLSQVRPSKTPTGMLRIKAEEIAARHKMSLSTVLSHDKRDKVVEARRELARYLRSLGKSYPKIGLLIGRDHTSALALVDASYRAKKCLAFKRRAARRALASSLAQPPERVLSP